MYHLPWEEKIVNKLNELEASRDSLDEMYFTLDSTASKYVSVASCNGTPTYKLAHLSEPSAYVDAFKNVVFTWKDHTITFLPGLRKIYLPERLYIT